MYDEQRRRFGPPAEDAPLADDAGAIWDTGEAEPLVPTDDWRPVPPVEEDGDEPTVSWISALFGLKRRERLEWRVRQLDRAIAVAPDAPVNYVLRGEVHLKLRRREQAAADFQTALSLTGAAFDASDWGLVAQALADRALMGLRRAGYHAAAIER